jgi:serine/threonine protein kinase
MLFSFQRYMSPEVAACKPYNQGADVYSFGVIFCEILFLSFPIPRSQCGSINLIRSRGNNHLPDAILNVMLSCLSPVIGDRPTIKDVYEAIRRSISQLMTI